MNTVPEYTEEIARLILQRISGTIGEEEAGLLDAWRKADPANEETYRRLLDSAFLEREWRRMKSVDASRPLADMQAKIRRGRSRRLVVLGKRAGVAAAVVTGLIVGGVVFFRHEPQPPLKVEGIGGQETALYASQIHPGETKAVLTTDDGQVIDLGADAVRNEKAIKNRRIKGRQENSTDVPRFNHLTTPRGGEFEITLEDGTKVWLNSASKLKYPVAFTGGQRKVFLEGEAYFEVAADTVHPFLVETSGMSVTVLGTGFNVMAYPEEMEAAVTLVHGKVGVQTDHRQQILQPDEQYVYRTTTRRGTVRKVDVSQYVDWKDGILNFDSMPLEELTRRLGRWYDVDFFFVAEELKTLKYSGAFKKYNDIRYVLNIIEEITNVQFVLNERTIVVNRK